jgi:hypothetical protein
MKKLIIYKNPEGSNVCICNPTGEIPIEQVLIKDCPEGAIIVDESTLPEADYDFFDAWELNGTTISVNLNKSKEITKNRLRLERTPLLQAQDVAFQRAIEANADTTAIVAEKQRLRDITQLADSATTTSELRAIKAGA